MSDTVGRDGGEGRFRSARAVWCLGVGVANGSDRPDPIDYGSTRTIIGSGRPDPIIIRVKNPDLDLTQSV